MPIILPMSRSADVALAGGRDASRPAVGTSRGRRLRVPMLTARSRTVLLLVAAALMAAAIRLPLWGMTLVSTNYPEGLRMVVYPSRITGDIHELNALNHYVGMMPISDTFFTELRLLPAAFALVALALAGSAFVRRRWAMLPPLAMMVALAVYGLISMRHRLWQFGHELDPAAAIDIPPFTPPMMGMHQIAQFAGYSYFTWGTFLPMVAGLLAVIVLASDLRRARAA